MQNSTRFEFYNNFDIWYDLYQENGGDPDFIIYIIIYSKKIGWNYLQENIIGCGYEHGNREKYGNGYGYKIGYGNGNDEGILFEDGDGIF